MFVSLQFKLELRKEDKEKLIQLMRKQSSAIRVAYNMLKELEKEKTKKPTCPNIPKTKTVIS
jgi:predicted transposase